MNIDTKTKNFFISYLSKYEEQATWLREIDWRSSIDKMKWSDKCNVDTGIIGMYSFGTIYLMKRPLCPELLFSTVVHELYHKWQYKQKPIIYILGKLYRPLIEDEADIETEKADNWINKEISICHV